MVDVLGRAADTGITTDFTYIVGLDEPEFALRQLAEFVPVTITIPRFQVCQSHTSLMDMFVADGARVIEFYLRMHREIDGAVRSGWAAAAVVGELSAVVVFQPRR